MSNTISEKTFTVVGTAINADGTYKVRWANDLVSRIKILIKAGCTEIDLIELATPMTKLDAAQFYLANRELSPAQEEVVSLKIGEKTRVVKRKELQTTITDNINTRVKNKTPSDPRVEKFVKSVTAEAADVSTDDDVSAEATAETA
jgi:hypothetical protein